MTVGKSGARFSRRAGLPYLCQPRRCLRDCWQPRRTPNGTRQQGGRWTRRTRPRARDEGWCEPLARATSKTSDLRITPHAFIFDCWERHLVVLYVDPSDLNGAHHAALDVLHAARPAAPYRPSAPQHLTRLISVAGTAKPAIAASPRKENAPQREIISDIFGLMSNSSG